MNHLPIAIFSTFHTQTATQWPQITVFPSLRDPKTTKDPEVYEQVEIERSLASLLSSFITTLTGSALIGK